MKSLFKSIIQHPGFYTVVIFLYLCCQPAQIAQTQTRPNDTAQQVTNTNSLASKIKQKENEAAGLKKEVAKYDSSVSQLRKVAVQVATDLPAKKRKLKRAYYPVYIHDTICPDQSETTADDPIFVANATADDYITPEKPIHDTVTIYVTRKPFFIRWFQKKQKINGRNNR